VACKMPRECNLLLKLLPAKATCPHFFFHAIIME
jgi:hypothetical protein